MPVILALGSNKGDSRAILTGAIGELGGILGGIRAASFYETAPWGVTDQPSFLNTCVSGVFSGTPRELLGLIQAVETRFGRDRGKERRWGERTLDIDIIHFDRLVFSAPPGLVIPHPHYTSRAFVLVPLLELYPAATDPLTGLSLQTCLEKLGDSGVLKKPH
jgi:2-amino-4-hydroxy-6-hydroxymethyldihydropteridine diphosphokinase